MASVGRKGITLAPAQLRNSFLYLYVFIVVCFYPALACILNLNKYKLGGQALALTLLGHLIRKFNNFSSEK